MWLPSCCFLRRLRGFCISITIVPRILNAPLLQFCWLLPLIRSIPSDLELYADEQMVNMILRNLITNAIKFSHRGGQIFIRAQARPDGVLLSVQDEGVGISRENQQKLWILSEQFTTRGTDDEEGSGLGLLLCKEFAERHGGSITVESELGKGTAFHILFPGIPKG